MASTTALDARLISDLSSGKCIYRFEEDLRGNSNRRNHFLLPTIPNFSIYSNVLINILLMYIYAGIDPWSRCRWTTNPGEPLLFLKYRECYLNILDVEKKALLLGNSVQLATICNNSFSFFFCLVSFSL